MCSSSFVRAFSARHTLMTEGSSDGRAQVDGSRCGIDIRIDAAIDIGFSSQGRALLKIIPAASDTST